MERRRTRIGVEMGLPIVRAMITDTAIRNELGETCQWLGNKERRSKIKAHQVAKVNEAAWSIARQLASVRIQYSDDRQAVIDQIKTLLKPVKFSFIYERHLGKDVTWWTYRTRALYGKGGYGYTFTEEEVLEINLAVSDIVNRLLSIELVVDELPEEE